MAVRFGSFGAEAFWTDPLEARLPAVPAPLSDDSLAGMDELLLGLCDRADHLVTLRPFEPSHADYLESLGFAAICHACTPDAAPPVCGALVGDSDFGWFERMAFGALLRPWAVTPDAAALARRLQSPPLPEVDVVRRVNSKAWSTQLRDRLGLANPGIVVGSAEELVAAGNRIGIPIVVKEEYGVSGSGSVVVTTPGRLERLTAALRRQEEEGYHVRLVVEPLFERAFDFSAQLTIRSDGGVHLTSIQAMHNRGLAYVSSAPPGDELLAVLERAGYEKFVRSVASAVQDEGYFGPLCVDSLVTSSGGVFPLVEINARHSLGLVNERIEAGLGRWGVRSRLLAERLSASAPADGKRLLTVFAERGLLWRPGSASGIVPLSLRSLPHAGGTGTESRTGRLWMSVPHKDPGSVPNVLTRVRETLSASGYTCLDRFP